MNSFTELYLNYSLEEYGNITEALHFKDAGHKAEAGFLFTKLINRINYTGDVLKIPFGLLNGGSKTEVVGNDKYVLTNDAFKVQYNYTKSNSNDKLIYDIYVFNNSKYGAYNLKYLTPVASGYIVIDGDTSNPIAINSTEMTLVPFDICLHHVQVYTGESTTVAFKGFLLEQQN